MKAIATVNFKGGVGKTTITWLLAQYAAQFAGKKILVVDTDAQMSLTMAVQLQDNGRLEKKFGEWYDNEHRGKKKTLLNALERYDEHINQGTHFNFPIDSSFVFEMQSNLGFVPSVVDLYWLELDMFNRQGVKHFVQTLLGRLEHSKNYNYDYVLFDCPPNFTALSYSVLSCCSLILVPVNPDIFASRGIGLIVDGLQLRIEPWPDPQIAVFMNKAGVRGGYLTRETLQYWGVSKDVCKEKKSEGVKIEAWESFIPERVDVKRAIANRTFPIEFVDDFASLWRNVERILK